ncbi:hypothetical protein KO561_05260 [Radiobacillus kanasensis]|uniref:hypothetical protein n=1 Tax=Radiobacillus kanasensis TaxID=2844358 RepID=UPI001E4663F9|nr:hypothetical protein [Radiobacillus kanasensis]UFU00359.1 hypothetical protein KO561_05260 [Radiobacillus kanasensis]
MVRRVIEVVSNNINWIILFLIITVIPPILFNFVILFDFPFLPVANNNEWIGFFGSFIGSIIGGSLTLIGVRLTLTKQDNQNFVDQAPTKLRNIDRISKKLDKIVEVASNCGQHGPDLIIYYKYKEIEEIHEEISNIASETDGIAYLIVFESEYIISEFEAFYKTFIKDNRYEALKVETGNEQEYTELLERLNSKITDIKNNLKYHKDNLYRKYVKLLGDYTNK